MYIKYLFLRIVMKKKWYAITGFLEIGLKILALLKWGLTGHGIYVVGCNRFEH